ncbi:hypothetical protein AX774_g787 [Zancudomyces culisetae]|uniref:Uncharacterized protein n=1 Tax=Zancudomyces culisetae TaxID=1213189 RepID=A0A1R1PXF3_ZANCU|nr:hypothetical protein AX774_g787 [Zancudomyces culisetae]|eukprot:OMH85655.1 hypothetical protein AX774_g787 [Zancudomyces culisetae]
MHERNISEPNIFLGKVGHGIQKVIEYSFGSKKHRVKNRSADILDMEFTMMHMKKQTMKAIEARKLGYPVAITCEYNCIWCRKNLSELVTGKPSYN